MAKRNLEVERERRILAQKIESYNLTAIIRPEALLVAWLLYGDKMWVEDET